MDLLLPEMGLVFWTVFSILVILLPIAAVYSLLTSRFKEGTSKLMWVLVILLLPIAGPMFYFLIGRKQRVTLA